MELATLLLALTRTGREEKRGNDGQTGANTLFENRPCLRHYNYTKELRTIFADICPMLLLYQNSFSVSNPACTVKILYGFYSTLSNQK